MIDIDRNLFNVDDISIEKLNLLNIIKLYSFLKRNKKEYKDFHPHKYSLYGILKNYFNKKDVFVVMMIKNKVIGYGMLRGWKEGFKVPTLGIMIDGNYRGMKIGYQMMEFLHKIAMRKNCKKIMLHVKKENKKAINLYKKMGYELSVLNDQILIGYKKLN